MDNMLTTFPDVFAKGENTEDGFYKIESAIVFVNPQTKKIIVLGSPQTHEREELIEVDHNCDFMGCGMHHVLVRGTIESQGY